MPEWTGRVITAAAIATALLVLVYLACANPAEVTPW